MTAEEVLAVRPVAQRPDYGLDSPAIIAGEAAAGGIALGGAMALYALRSPRPFGIPLWGVAAVLGGFCLLNAGGMVYYSVAGKRHIRDRLLDLLPWRGDERVLDVGCGRGLLLIGAARRLPAGTATGVDVWVPGAITGNRPEAALRNATLEGVADRVDVRRGEAQRLPFADGAFDTVVSNFVVHEMDTPADRERMLREMARVLKPGGRVALADFIFTPEAVRVLRDAGLADVWRVRLSSWPAVIASLGLVRVYAVTARKPQAAGAVPQEDVI
jgi:SAM-dependent methyltransferase